MRIPNIFNLFPIGLFRGSLIVKTCDRATSLARHVLIKIYGDPDELLLDSLESRSRWWTKFAIFLGGNPNFEVLHIANKTSNIGLLKKNFVKGENQKYELHYKAFLTDAAYKKRSKEYLKTICEKSGISPELTKNNPEKLLF